MRNLRGYSLDELAAASGIAIECLQAAEAGNLDRISASGLVQLGMLLGKADRLSTALASENLFEEYERRTHETA